MIKVVVIDNGIVGFCESYFDQLYVQYDFLFIYQAIVLDFSFYDLFVVFNGIDQVVMYCWWEVV